MESVTRCPACRARIGAAVTACPACGARPKSKPKAARPEDAGDDVRLGRKPRRKRKKTRTGPNYALFALLGGGVVIAGALGWVAPVCKPTAVLRRWDSP